MRTVAQQAAVRPQLPRPVAAATYRIAGKVVDAHTGTPLGRCSVQIADVKDRGESRTVTSADDGSFAFGGLSLGKYSLTAERRGYMAQSYEEHDQFSTAIAVGPGLDSENLVFKLTAEAVITGTITDEAGEPVRGAQVRLFQDQDTDGTRATRLRHNVMTDDRGVYEFSGLHPGAYFLVVTAHPWYAQRLRMAQAGNDQGDSATPEAQPLDVAYPTVFYPGVPDQESAVPIPIKGGDRLEANLTIAAEPAIRVRIDLPKDSVGNGGVSVQLSRSIFGQTEPLPMEMTGVNGAMVITGVLPGHYDVTMTHFAPGVGEGSSRHFETDLTAGSTEIAEETGVGEVTVTGKVVSAAGKLPPSAGISLRATGNRRTHYAQIKEDGGFSLEVAPGTYEVVGNINGLHFISLKAAGASLAGRMLTVKPGDAPKLEIEVGTGHGEIEGTALRNGKPASAVMVLLAPEDPKNNPVLFRRDQSDSDGTFDLPNIFPGRYRLLAIEDGWQLEWANPSVLQVFPPKSVPIEIKAGDHLNQTVEVQTR
jgi:hypothetical protein